jgi:hypothetical protein
MYSGLKKVKKWQQLATRTKMIDGVAKMELDLEEGRCYAASSICVEEGDMEGEQPARKKAKANNSLTSSTQDHQRMVSSKNCSWKGLNKKEVLKNYEKRMKEMEMTENILTTTCSAEPMEEIVQPTSKYLAPRCRLLLQHQNFVCNTQPHVTHLVALLHTASTAGNPTSTQAMPSVDIIAVITKVDTGRCHYHCTG